MGRITRKGFDLPDEVRKVEGGMGQIDLVNVEGGVVGIPPGQDGWVIGDEPAETIEWQGMKDYARH